MKKGTCAQPEHADALEAYWESQNRRLKLLERFVEQGNPISGELLQAVKNFEETDLTVFEQMAHGQKMLLSQLCAVPQTQSVAENTNPWANPVIDAIDREDLIYLEPLPLFNPDGTVMG